MVEDAKSMNWMNEKAKEQGIPNYFEERIGMLMDGFEPEIVLRGRQPSGSRGD